MYICFLEVISYLLSLELQTSPYVKHIPNIAFEYCYCSLFSPQSTLHSVANIINFKQLFSIAVFCRKLLAAFCNLWLFRIR